MAEVNLSWRDISATGRRIIQGPRSLILPKKVGDRCEQWLDRLFHWHCNTVAPGIPESCTIYRRFEFEGASCWPYVVRYASWDQLHDRESYKQNGSIARLSLQVQHLELSEAAVTEVARREEEVDRCVLAMHSHSLPPAKSADAPGKVFEWTFCGNFLTRNLSWISSSRSADLESLWLASRPDRSKLLTVSGLIERYDVELHDEIWDVDATKIQTCHLYSFSAAKTTQSLQSATGLADDR
jgi:hypothetical protein